MKLRSLTMWRPSRTCDIISAPKSSAYQTSHVACGHGPTRAKKKKTVVLKDAQYIIDLEDNHSGGKHLVITIKEGSTSDRRKEQYQKLKRRQQLEPEDTQHHNRKQARLDKIVCGICNRAECNGCLLYTSPSPRDRG